MPSAPEQLAVELAEQKLALTQQFLGAHQLVLEDGTPPVAGVVTKDGTLDVYFKVQDEPYFLVVIVGQEEDGWQVKGCRAEARCEVYLRIVSDVVPPEEVIRTVGLAPTESWRLGDPMRVPGRTYKFHAWHLNPAGEGPGEFEDKLRALLDATETAAPHIRSLTETCDVGVVVAYFGYKDQMWGLPMGARDVERLARVGAGLDVDLYASGPDLADGGDGEGLTLLR